LLKLIENYVFLPISLLVQIRQNYKRVNRKETKLI